jgi:hypothetical protein
MLIISISTGMMNERIAFRRVERPTITCGVNGTRNDPKK